MDKTAFLLSAEQILAIWEHGIHLSQNKRSIVILSVLMSGCSSDELAMFSLGHRNRYLLAIYQSNFGSSLQCFARCPKCQEALEFGLNLNDLQSKEEAVSVLQFEVDHFLIHFRLLSSLDLTIAASEIEFKYIYRKLLEQCIVEATSHGHSVSVTELPEQVLLQLEYHLQQADPGIEFLLKLNCEICQHQWSSSLDIGMFLWHEIEAYAQRLLTEVHQLAFYYGWSETSILDLSIARRQFYLEKMEN